MVKRVVVIGGGVTGLATALHLKDRSSQLPGGLEVRVLEASDRVGGNIQTELFDDFIIEKGPNGYLDNAPATQRLVRRLALEDVLQRADEAAAMRYLFRRGRLHLLPSGPVSFLSSGVLSLPGRLRVLGEPLAPKKPDGTDETVFDFAARRIGKEAASILVDAMVSGVFAGDSRALSLSSSFPKMAEMEEEHGSLVRAMVARRREGAAARKEAEERRARGESVEELVEPGGPAGPGGTLTSFRGGLETLPRALFRELEGSVGFGARVVGIEQDGDDEPWRIHLSEGESVSAHALVVGVPSPRAAPFLRTLDKELASTVGEIRTAGLAVVALGYDTGDLGGDPGGFGFLVPRGTGPRILGCLWDSSIFPGRAPDGKALFRAMIGGAHDPDAVNESEEALVTQVREDLRTAMSLTAPPLFTRVYRWPLGIGQYTVGHQARLDRIHARLREHPGLWMAGSSFYGISMNACIQKAEEQAGEIFSFLSGT